MGIFVLEGEAPPARILMEASGLANPVAVMAAVRRYAGSLGILKSVAVVEAEIWAARSVMGESFHMGLATADLLILNKTEEMAPGEISAMAEISPGAISSVLLRIKRSAVARPMWKDSPMTLLAAQISASTTATLLRIPSEPA